MPIQNADSVNCKKNNNNNNNNTYSSNIKQVKSLSFQTGQQHFKNTLSDIPRQVKAFFSFFFSKFEFLWI